MCKRIKLLLTILLIFIQFIELKAQVAKLVKEQKTITVVGIVLNQLGVPPEQMFVVEKGTYNSVETDFQGNYSIEVLPSAELQFVEKGVLIKTISLKDNDTLLSLGKDQVQMNVIYDSNINLKNAESFTSGGSTSMKNYWIGAKVGYNFIGETDDNFFVGSASIALNMFKGSTNKHSFAVIGNLGNFKFDKDTDSSEDVQKIAQSINGLSIGLGYTREFEIDKKNEQYIRLFTRTGVRMTTFDDIGEDMSSVNLAQSATNLGAEYELGNFENGGRISIATGFTMYLFDESVYNKIFEEERSSLFTLDTTIILPISEDLGLFVNGTFTKRASAVFILGIIFRT